MSKKRANREGSVYKTKDGRVIGSWQDANGKTRYMTSKTMTKREMSKAVRKKLQDRDEGIAAHSEGLTHHPLNPPPSYKPVSRPKPPLNRAPAHSFPRGYRRAADSISNTTSSRTASK